MSIEIRRNRFTVVLDGFSVASFATLAQAKRFQRHARQAYRAVGLR